MSHRVADIYERVHKAFKKKSHHLTWLSSSFLVYFKNTSVRQPASKQQSAKMARKTGVKKNPLKNDAVLFRLNPYAQSEKRTAQNAVCGLVLSGEKNLQKYLSRISKKS